MMVAPHEAERQPSLDDSRHYKRRDIRGTNGTRIGTKGARKVLPDTSSRST